MAKCKICTKSVYPMDPQINLDGTVLHKSCAKCADCACQITLSNFAKHDGGDQFTLLCKTHYFKRFRESGSYLGGEKFEKKQDRDVRALSRNDLEPAKSTPVQTPVVTQVAPAEIVQPSPQVQLDQQDSEQEPEPEFQPEPEPDSLETAVEE